MLSPDRAATEFEAVLNNIQLPDAIREELQERVVNSLRALGEQTPRLAQQGLDLLRGNISEARHLELADDLYQQRSYGR